MDKKMNRTFFVGTFMPNKFVPNYFYCIVEISGEKCEKLKIWRANTPLYKISKGFFGGWGVGGGEQLLICYSRRPT